VHAVAFQDEGTPFNFKKPPNSRLGPLVSSVNVAVRSCSALLPSGSRIDETVLDQTAIHPDQKFPIVNLFLLRSFGRLGIPDYSRTSTDGELRPDLVKRRPRTPESGVSGTDAGSGSPSSPAVVLARRGRANARNVVTVRNARLIASKPNTFFGELVEASSKVDRRSCRSGRTIPLESDVPDCGKLLERPSAQDRLTAAPVPGARRNAEHEGHGTIETKRTEHLIGVPGALPFGKMYARTSSDSGWWQS